MVNSKINNNHIKLLNFLRENSRQSFSEIHKKTNIPTSTLFDYYWILRNEKIITKNVSLIDFKKLDFSIRVVVFIKAHKKLKLYKFLVQSENINSISKLKAYDFSFEAFFKSMEEMDSFMDKLSSFDVITLQKFDILEEIKKRGFFMFFGEFLRQDFTGFVLNLA